MSNRVHIDAYDVSIAYTPDVCIIGAGPTGVSAAVAAARIGLSVLIIEKYGFCGGATVAGLSGTICGLYSSGNSPEQIVFGFADEFYQALKSRGGTSAPAKFGKTLLIPHDSLTWKETADDFLMASGCKVLYHTHFLKAIINAAGSIAALLVKAPEGQFAITPKYVIDASGDAEVVASINGKTFMGNNGVVQTPTMIFKMANVDVNAFMALDPCEIDEQVVTADRSGEYMLPRHHVYIFPLPNTGEVLCNMTRITYPDGSVPVGTSSADLTYAEIEGRKQAREYSRFLKDKIAAFRYAYIADTGTQVGIRQTRSIAGKATLYNQDVMQAKKSENAITHSAWPIEAHGAGELKIIYLEDDYYDLLFETLIPQGAVNLLVAGRCLSAEHEALASVRVTAQCFGMGYAVGAACGLMKHEHKKADELTGAMMTNWMKENKLKTVHASFFNNSI